MEAEVNSEMAYIGGGGVAAGDYVKKNQTR